VRHCAAVVAAVAAGASIAAAGANAAGAVGPSMSAVARVAFPDRAFLIGLPAGKQLSSSDVVVHENGQLVDNPSLVPAGAASEELGTLLVVDTSNSMRGTPLHDALDAVRGFASEFSSSNERIGLLTFNSSWRLVQKPSAAADLSNSLSEVGTTKQGTHIYDALAAALDVIRASKLVAGSIVLLSDGADTGSTTSATQLTTRARNMRVRIFTVGLHSGAFSAAPLARLARATGGTFAEATSSAALASIFGVVGHRLASEYLLRYRSQASPGSPVVVAVQIHGAGFATIDYTPPKIANVPPFHRSVFERFWASPASLAVISLLIALFAGIGVAGLAHRPSSTLQRRISEFATLRSRARDPEDDKALPSARLLGATERSLARTEWWTRFREELVLANISISAEQVLGLAIVGTLLAGLLLYLAAPIFALFSLGVPALVLAYCRRALRKVRWEFEAQLPDNLQVLASALRAGHSFIGALSVVAADSVEPSKREFTRIVADEQLGVPLEDSLREVARRMDNSDLEQVALVAELQRRSGGNMAEVLDRVVETVRGRFDLRRMVRTLTAQGRLARWILTILPIFLAGIISLLDPSYMRPLFASGGGQAALAVAGFMVIMGSLAIKRIVEIKV
jgi:tight adherence protein B